jgi:uncharacterized protein
VLIVNGGPGTGKSVLAINFLVELTKQNMVSQYVTKNAAPKNIYSTKLKKYFVKGILITFLKNQEDILTHQKMNLTL